MLLDAHEVAARLTMRPAIDELEDPLRDAPFPPAPQRLHLDVDAVESGGEAAELLVITAAVPGWAGTKLVGLIGMDPARRLARVDSSDVPLAPPGLCTAAVSGLATRFTARSDARRHCRCAR
jgi:ornithine cyclodeaminase/alanine dehydrogenase-like protein (mu-crystallin family)